MWSQSRSGSRSQSRGNVQEWKAYEDVQLIDGDEEEYDEDNIDDDVFCIESNNDEHDNEKSTKFEDVKQYIYKDGKKNCSSFCLTIVHSLKVIVIDCGATRSVVGIEWLKDFMELLSNDERKRIKQRRNNRFFRFGNAVRYPSRLEVSIPITLGRLKTTIQVSLVDAKIPLLVGAPDMKRLGMTVNFERDKVFISQTKEYLDLKKNSNGHLTLPLTLTPMAEDTHEILQMRECNEKDKKEKIKKVHHIFGHPKERTLKD